MTRLPQWQGGPSSLGGGVGIASGVDEEGQWRADALQVSAYGAAGQAETGQAVSIAAGGLWREATALALMTEGPHDIRPDILLYVAAQDDARFERLATYGCNYLFADQDARGEYLSAEVIEVAVGDALQILQQRRAALTIRQRALELGIRAATFGHIRRRAVRLFQRRYREAAERYSEALLGVVHTRKPAL